MKKRLFAVAGLLMTLPAFSQTPDEKPCLNCGEVGGKHKSDCIFGDKELLDQIFTKEDEGYISADDACAADTFVVDFNNKEQILLFKDPKVKRCAMAWDKNKDGKLSVGEAEEVTKLVLMYPSRKDMFMISTYDDLRFFPNLEYLDAGKSFVEVIDLSHNPRLKEINLYGCQWPGLKEVRYAEGVKMVYKPSQDPWKRAHGIYDSWSVFVRENLVDKDEDLSAYRDKNDSIFIENESFRDRCFSMGADRNYDGIITACEAEEVGTLDFNEAETVEGPRFITDFSELRYFPRLHTLRTGTTYIDKLDLSNNLMLKEVDASRCKALTTIVLAKGCNPHIIMPEHIYKGKAPRIVRVKPSKQIRQN